MTDTFCEWCNEPIDPDEFICAACRTRMTEWNNQTPADRRASELRHPSGKRTDR